MMLPAREKVLRRLAEPLLAALEDREELQFTADLLRARGRKLNRHSIVAHETLSRQFLQQRHQIYGQMPGPWPVEFRHPLEVWHRKEGFNFAAGKPFTKIWEARISKARFVKLGSRKLARYVELELPTAEIITDPHDREFYGYEKAETVPVYCTLRTLITAGPSWVMDWATTMRVARARAVARRATENTTKGDAS